MTTPQGYIEIDRRFRDLSPSGSEESAIASYVGTSLGAPSGMGWDDILKKKLVVVLDEPGSGKSWKFRHRCSVIREGGEFAFFIPLDQLVGASLEEILSPEDKEAFKAWKRSNRTARFFLDSVDEAKIRKQSDFYRALDRIKNDIGPAAIDRAEFTISSRISEWRPETDRSEVLSRFSVRPPDDAETPNEKPRKIPYWSFKSSRSTRSDLSGSSQAAGSQIPKHS